MLGMQAVWSTASETSICVEGYQVYRAPPVNLADCEQGRFG